MSLQSITQEQLTALGESQTLEFKRSLSLLKEAFADLCAMVNAAPAVGVVVFGVEPDGAVCGLGQTNLDSAQKKLALHSQQKIDPPLALEIHTLTCESLPVLLLRGSRARSVPFHEYDGCAYIRIGSASLQMSVAQKQQLTVHRDRALHQGPWRCDRCDAFSGMISSVEVTAAGPRKTYKHGCGGEWWPAG